METVTAIALSAECVLARNPGCRCLHAQCRQLKDVPLPHTKRVLLVARCYCS
jgi:hypothetical protein